MNSPETPTSSKESELLRNWFSGQSNWATWRAVADALPVPYSSLKKYVHGRPIRVAEHRARIYRLTGIEAFRPDGSNLPSERDTVPPSGHDTPKTRLAVQLRQWFSQQDKFQSFAEMARSIGIAESTLRDYFIGRALPKPKNLTILEQVTHLNSLDEILSTTARYRGGESKGLIPPKPKSVLRRLNTIRKGFASLAEEVERLVKETAKHSAAEAREAADQTATGRSKTVADLLLRLKGELEFFKSGTAEDREAFRRAIVGEQLGYLVSLLKALYDEDVFREWIHFSQLDLTEKR